MDWKSRTLALRRSMQLAHRWLGALLLVQLLLWMASGAFMSLVNMDEVRGAQNRSLGGEPELLPRAYFPPGGVIAGLSGAESVELRSFDSRAVYLVTHDAGETMFDAETGARIQFSEARILAVARNSFVGDGEPVSARLLEEAPVDYRGETPVWQVTINDKARTRIYISSDTGKVLAHRNRLWRVYDFFWMLHIMDYDERSNYSNPLMRIFSVTGLLFALTGAVLVWTRIRSGRYREDIARAGHKKS